MRINNSRILDYKILWTLWKCTFLSWFYHRNPEARIVLHLSLSCTMNLSFINKSVKKKFIPCMGTIKFHSYFFLCFNWKGVLNNSLVNCCYISYKQIIDNMLSFNLLLSSCRSSRLFSLSSLHAPRLAL